MGTETSFECAWLSKLSQKIRDHAGVEMEEAVLQGSESLDSARSDEEIIAWTHDAIKRLKLAVDEETFQNIMTGCACLYPHERLKPMRDHYAATGDLEAVHKMLQAQFEVDIKSGKNLDDNDLDFIRANDWGVAGRLEGNYIYATKMPTRFREYMDASTQEEKNYNYCHCPRIKAAFQDTDTKLTADYCYCSAGYYKDIWQQILGKTVKVEVMKSLLSGDDLCLIRIHLPV